ncbi:MAG: anthranilate synthase component I family protein [Bacteroidetes bacterium]|nr:anthranilate synthase component I family protein [Bacteroidota bacterium]
MQTPAPYPTIKTVLPDSFSWKQIQNFVQQQNPGFILASPLKNDHRSKFEFAGFSPETLILVFSNRLEIHSETGNSVIPLDGSNPLKEIENIVNLGSSSKLSDPLITGGWFFAFSYEFSSFLTASKVETFPVLPSELLGVGLKPKVLFRHDLKNGSIDLLHPQDFPTSNLIVNLKESNKSDSAPVETDGVHFTESFNLYSSKVESLRNHIRDGDTYEVNYVHELKGNIKNGNPSQIWDSLISYSPSSFFTWFKLDHFTLLSSSPERFFKTTGRQITVQPMKGTRRRDSDPEIDLRMKTELSLSEKDQAENLMIVDLMRNDLGKICKTGSVKVKSLFEVESYQTVHQMISTITGELPENETVFSVIEALFPPGSMTGAPKKRTMELIRKYESGPRGFYSGISGYVDYSGNSEWSVLIRCIEFIGKVFSAKAGGAITSDSKAEEEYAETITKLKGILESLNIKPESIINMDSGPIKKGY